MRYCALLQFLLLGDLIGVAQSSFITSKNEGKTLTLSLAGKTTPLVVTSKDFPGVLRAAYDLQDDLQRITDAKPTLHINALPKANVIVLIGTLGKNQLIDQLVETNKLNVDELKGKWETFLIQTIENPFPLVEQALVIAGSDKRGTIFGIYELSKQIGVSPWYWWADVPPQKKQELYVKPGRYVQGEPAVKYRGIFINDEEPALGRWAMANYGGFTSEFYKKVFELILRLKGNYLWPAMWWASFNEDDPVNPKLADEYGIVMGTTHHEPMNRAHADWKKNGKGPWNYETNEATLQVFWKEGIERVGNRETIISLGMRGDGDMAMSKETNIALLERIVEDQREMLANVTGKDVAQTPQLWALYKEVQDYYDQGMRVPDDITLLLCDDNWGNIRKLPDLKDKPRSGGYGIYYHFDYVGGPRNYKWLNTNQIERVWEQMHLAYNYGVNRIWIVNVGDIKPMEYPISFFLDYAWNPAAIQADQLQVYTEQWCVQQFGPAYANETASLLSLYTKYNARIKPELLDDKTYSLNHYNEFEQVVKEYIVLAKRASDLSEKINASQKEAYFQLVLHPIISNANLYQLYYYVALNKQAISQNDPQANFYADQAKEHYRKDSLITLDYHQRNQGKWNHMMSQTHIGYTYWQQPPVNKMPAVNYLIESVSKKKETLGVSHDAKDLIQGTPAGHVFFEKDQYVSIEAQHTSAILNANEITWKVLPNHGKTGSSITPFPVTAPAQKLSSTSTHIEYEFYSYSEGDATLQLFFSPTLNFHNTQTGLQYGISIDDEPVQVMSLNADGTQPKTWERWVANNIIVKTTSHTVGKPGKHTIKFWMIHPGVVLQKLVLDFGGVKPTYLGPPETKYITR